MMTDRDRDRDEGAGPPGAEDTPGTAPATPRRGSRLREWAIRGGLALLVAAVAAFLIPWEYAHVPGESAVLKPTPTETDQAFDVRGRRISRREAADMAKTAEGRALLSPANGAVATDVDPSTGFGRDDQDALIHSVLTYRPGRP